MCNIHKVLFQIYIYVFVIDPITEHIFHLCRKFFPTLQSDFSWPWLVTKNCFIKSRKVSVALACISWSSHFHVLFRFLGSFISHCSLKKKVWIFLRCKSPFLAPSQSLWLSTGHDLCLQKVCVAADYSDSVPDSSSYTSNQGYHPLEALKACNKTRQTELSSAEIARTAVEVCLKACSATHF